MALISMRCLAFALITAAAYFILPKKIQWAALLAGNIYFYLSFGPKYIFFLLFAGVVSYAAALWLQHINDTDPKSGKKKTVSALAVIAILFFWLIFKYGNFVIDNLNAVLQLFDDSLAISPMKALLPLGMSFYTFHAIGYVVDVYRKKYRAEKSFFKYFTFMAFFPHMIQGPFSRFDELGKTMFSGHGFSYSRLCDGAARVLWGVFKKVVIADPLASTVDMILKDYQNYGGIHIVFAVIVYSIRLYADFSGYTDIVCGYCHILGIDLAENFRRPYFAKTVDEYWRRWHITLGKWFRDYVFYPVSMGKNGVKLSKWARKKWGPKMGKLVSGYFALIFVWTATGLWHGASWTYLIWGYLNLLAIVSTTHLSDLYDRCKQKLHINSDSAGWKAFCILRTYFLVSIFRFFAISSSVGEAFMSIAHVLTDFRISALTQLSGFFVGMYREEIIITGIAVIFLVAVDVLQEGEKWDKLKAGCPALVRALIYSVMLLMIVMMTAGSDVSKGFIYANF